MSFIELTGQILIFFFALGFALFILWILLVLLFVVVAMVCAPFVAIEEWRENKKAKNELKT